MSTSGNGSGPVIATADGTRLNRTIAIGSTFICRLPATIASYSLFTSADVALSVHYCSGHGVQRTTPPLTFDIGSDHCKPLLACEGHCIRFHALHVLVHTDAKCSNVVVVRVYTNSGNH